MRQDTVDIDWEQESRGFWKAVPGFPGYYASVDGRVRGPRRILTPYVTKDGYEHVKIWRDGVRHSFFVSRLVCMAFYGLPKNKKQEASHLNGKRRDNRPGNLAWETKAQNNYRRRSP